MVKRATSSERIRKQAAVGRNLFQRDELVAAVCKYFCRGMPVAEILDEVKQKLKITLKREEPYRLIAFAAQRGWLKFQAPFAHELATQIRERFPLLADVRVVRTGVSDDISYNVAAMLHYRQPLITHLVADSRSARALLGQNAVAKLGNDLSRPFGASILPRTPRKLPAFWI